jgi:hypothetical protein
MADKFKIKNFVELPVMVDIADDKVITEPDKPKPTKTIRTIISFNVATIYAYRSYVEKNNMQTIMHWGGQKLLVDLPYEEVKKLLFLSTDMEIDADSWMNGSDGLGN